MVRKKSNRQRALERLRKDPRAKYLIHSTDFLVSWEDDAPRETLDVVQLDTTPTEDADAEA